MIVFAALLLGVGFGLGFSAQESPRLRRASWTLVAGGCVAATLAAVLSATGGRWPASAEWIGWTAWSVVGLVGAVAATFARTLRTSLAGCGLATAAAALLLLWDDSVAGALSTVAATGAVTAIVLRRRPQTGEAVGDRLTPSQPVVAESEQGVREPWLGATAAALLAFVLFGAATTPETDAFRKKSSKSPGPSRTVDHSEPATAPTGLASLLAPVLMVVAVAALQMPAEADEDERQ